MSVRVLIVGRDEALRCIAWQVIVAVHCGKLQQIGAGFVTGNTQYTSWRTAKMSSAFTERCNGSADQHHEHHVTKNISGVLNAILSQTGITAGAMRIANGSAA